MKLNRNDICVFTTIYKSETPVTATQIQNSIGGTPQSSIQATIRKLLALELVEVKGVAYSGNVLSRTFCATEKSKALIEEMVIEELEKFNGIIDRTRIVGSLFKSEDDVPEQIKDLDKIEKLITELRKRQKES